MSESQSRVSERCVSDLAIDRYLADELSAGAAASLQAHAEACLRCGERLAVLAAKADADREALPPLTVAVSGGPSRSAVGLSVLAIAAGLLLAVMLGRAFLGAEESAGATPERVAQTRTKGRAHLTLYVRNNGRVQAFDGEPVRVGDDLAFSYTSAVNVHLAVFDVDGGETTCLLPNAETTAEMQAGTDVELDLAVQLDGSVAEESIVAVFCEDSRSIAALTDALSSGGSLPDSCVAEWIRLPKEGR